MRNFRVHIIAVRKDATITISKTIETRSARWAFNYIIDDNDIQDEEIISAEVSDINHT